MKLILNQNSSELSVKYMHMYVMFSPNSLWISGNFVCIKTMNRRNRRGRFEFYSSYDKSIVFFSENLKSIACIVLYRQSNQYFLFTRSPSKWMFWDLLIVLNIITKLLTYGCGPLVKNPPKHLNGGLCWVLNHFC